MPSVEDQLSDLRHRLLDLTLRNKLLNHRSTKRRTLPIVDEIPREVYETLVVQGKKMRFLPTEPKDGEQEESLDILTDSQSWEVPDLEEALADRHVDLALQTTLNKEVLQKKLFFIGAESDSFLEEQGYTALYLALGFLEWYESPTSELARRAPLVLVPVSLERTGVRQAFKIQWTEEDVSGNISLAAKLIELGVTLPEFSPATSKEALVRYFKEILEATSDQSRWSIAPDVVLDFFSFAKFVMYKDLDPNSWPEGRSPANNKVIRAVIDPESSESGGGGFDPDSIDQVLKPSTLYHVLDADPSQIAVIEDAKKGQNLVVEGPPGTGKSQTITNLIAELLAAGKTVLFASEKMAALSVVKERLEKVGLGAFCVEVHSRKSSKKQFLQQLESAARLRFPEPDGVERAFAELEALRDDLNNYASALREPVGTIGLCPADLFAAREKALTHFTKVGREPKDVVLEAMADRTSDGVAADKRALREFSSALRPVFPLAANPWTGCSARDLLPPDVAELEQSLRAARTVLARVVSAVEKLAQTADIAGAETLSAIPGMLAASRIVGCVPNVDRVTVDHAVQGESIDRISLIEAVVNYGVLRERVLTHLRPDAFETDAAALDEELQANASSIFRWFKGAYRALRRQLGNLYQSSKAPANDVVLGHLKTLREAINLRSNLRKSMSEGLRAFGAAWKSDESDAEALQRIDEWLGAFVRGIEAHEIGRRATAKAFDSHVTETLPELNKDVETIDNELRGSWTNIRQILTPDETIFSGSKFSECAFQTLDAKLSGWVDGLPGLTSWGTFVRLRERVEHTDAAPLLELIGRDEIDPDDVVPTFEHNIVESVLRSAFRARPPLAQFSPDLQAERVERFAQLDRALIQKNRLRLAAKLSSSRPPLSAGASPSSGVGILLGQFNRQKGHMPIRKIMARCGPVIKKITPCFMMSPLSIAQFLDPTISGFDVVIFDEASQVRPEEALGALIRSEQAIVIGDTQQLPPTSFFDQVVEDTMIESDDQAVTIVGEMESILHQCRRSFATRRLTWHYRSQHESLIAVSNREFYNNELRIYPSSTAKAPNLGLELRRLNDTTYDRGRSGVNRGEARAVADAVIKHYSAMPQHSLGVGTFSVKQQHAILEEVEFRRRSKPDLDEYFDRAHPESFFVKNLETIQGDERDVIYVSVGYGFDPNQRFSQHFGPVNLQGGQRRLNVLFTRARKHCVLFSNFGGEQISVNEGSPFGVRALKTFLEYAKTHELPEDGHPLFDAESPFEESVAETLRAEGHEVVHQVGCAGFRVDLAVRDPKAPGRYLIGVECDGAKYHSSPVARDRDRLRQQILESRGWLIHRVWSTDWYRSRTSAERRLLAAVMDAHTSHTKQTELLEDGDDTELNPMDHATVAEFEEIEVDYYQTCDSLGVPPAGNLHQQSIAVLCSLVEAVVHVESPVHKDEVIRRIRTLWGIKRAGSRIQAALEQGVLAAAKRRSIRVQGSFLWLTDQRVTPVRRRGGDPPPDIGLICEEEIGEAVTAVLETQFATSQKELAIKAARVLGIGSTTQKVAARIGKVIDKLTGTGDLVRDADDGRLCLRSSN